MPTRPKHPCNHPGCPALTTERFCEKHKQSQDNQRPSARKRGYDTRWEKCRLIFLRTHPLCAECKREGRVASAAVVDHIKPHKGNQELFWNETNWQPLCKECHDRKTATEDGGFGHYKKRGSVF